jgi:hypothetical protein
MDIDREIQNLKKLIVTAEGETLDYPVEQLHTLLTKQRAERQAREHEDQPTTSRYRTSSGRYTPTIFRS